MTHAKGAILSRSQWPCHQVPDHFCCCFNGFRSSLPEHSWGGNHWFINGRVYIYIYTHKHTHIYIHMYDDNISNHRQLIKLAAISPKFIQFISIYINLCVFHCFPPSIHPLPLPPGPAVWSSANLPEPPDPGGQGSSSMGRLADGSSLIPVTRPDFGWLGWLGWFGKLNSDMRITWWQLWHEKP